MTSREPSSAPQDLCGAERYVLVADLEGRALGAGPVDTPATLGGVPVEAVEAARRGESWTGPASPSGGAQRLRTVPLHLDGEVVGLVVLAGDAGPDVAATADLARVVADIAGTTDLYVLAKVVTASASEVLGADAASLCVLDGDALRVVGLHSTRPVDPSQWRRIPLVATNPLAEAVRAGEVVVGATRAEIDRRWPGLFPPETAERSLIVLPLMTGERCVGSVGLAFPELRAFDGGRRGYLGALADSCAQAIERIQATMIAAAASAKLRYLADASAALATSLDYEATLRRVADLAVPAFADWCAIDLLEEGSFRRVAVSHVDPAKVALAQELWERYPPQMDAPTGAPGVARTGVSELVEHVDDELLDQLGLDDEQRRLVRELQLRSGLTVALTARGRTLGVLAFVYAESGRSYSPADVPFAEDLARRAALAIDNSQLHTETLEVALQLQRAVLPETFPDSDRWQVAVHYRPAGRTDVGGDFYDAITLPDGRLVALVGDVMGRGVAAAAAMAQVRAALRAFIALDPDPRTVAGRVDTMFDRLDISQLVTMLYLVVQPGAGSMSVLSAGHLPALAVGTDGSTRWLEVAGSPPLGVAVGERPVTDVALREGETVLAYSDGLVERRGEDLDDGLQRLAVAAGVIGSGLNDTVLVRLADELSVAGHDDDVTLLAVRAIG